MKMFRPEKYDLTDRDTLITIQPYNDTVGIMVKSSDLLNSKNAMYVQWYVLFTYSIAPPFQNIFQDFNGTDFVSRDFQFSSA